MYGFIIVLICVVGSMVWGITAGTRRRKELDKQHADQDRPTT